MAKKKRRVRVKQKAQVRKKGEGRDSLKKVQGRPPADVAPTLRIKVKKKQ